MDTSTVSFEEAFDRLEDTVDALEQGDLTLDGALVLFEQGMKLVQQCNTLLDGAELRIRQLMATEDGYVLADIEPN